MTTTTTSTGYNYYKASRGFANEYTLYAIRDCSEVLPKDAVRITRAEAHKLVRAKDNDATRQYIGCNIDGESCCRDEFPAY